MDSMSIWYVMIFMVMVLFFLAAGDLPTWKLCTLFSLLWMLGMCLYGCVWLYMQGRSIKFLVWVIIMLIGAIIFVYFFDRK
uniref:Uncharacterized protein n=1 Tax=Dreissena rostriformis TaxID=205083 RepID=A0A894JP08_9BIVA|nr:hypothetical protein K8L31_mgp12 [Dreissena rostriformis]QRV59730.1 hypothetical protein [Dreissena rostriformis]